MTIGPGLLPRLAQAQGKHCQGTTFGPGVHAVCEYTGTYHWFIAGSDYWLLIVDKDAAKFFKIKTCQLWLIRGGCDLW